MPDVTAARAEMVESQLRRRGIADERMLRAMGQVPRHEFVPEMYREQSYEDHPLPIGEGQTISQPYVVALMLAALQIKPKDKVLEVGTGSGYATALLAELGADVFSIERRLSLAERARAILLRLGYTNAHVRKGDGTKGWGEEAPFDAILVSAAAAEVPGALVEQLVEGGRMIVPVGAGDAQVLIFVRKVNGQAVISTREAVRFVPLISGE